MGSMSRKNGILVLGRRGGSLGSIRAISHAIEFGDHFMDLRKMNRKSLSRRYGRRISSRRGHRGHADLLYLGVLSASMRTRGYLRYRPGAVRAGDNGSA